MILILPWTFKAIYMLGAVWIQSETGRVQAQHSNQEASNPDECIGIIAS